MRAALHDFSVVHRHNFIRVPDCAQAVGDDNYGAIPGDGAHVPLYYLFGFKVEGTGRLVEDQDARVGQ